MKVKVLSRNPDEYLRETKRDIHKGKPTVGQLSNLSLLFLRMHKTAMHKTIRPEISKQSISLAHLKHNFTSVPRNYDPTLHPFEAPREYTRALNAVKLDRVFAKPFIGNLEGHKDAVSCMCKHPTRLQILLSGAFDGEVRVWDLPQRTCERSFLAHDGNVRGVTFVPDAEHFITIGDDKTIKTWKADKPDGEEEEPVNTIISKVCIV